MNLALPPAMGPPEMALWEGMVETLIMGEEHEGGLVGGHARVCLDTMNGDIGQEQVSLLLCLCQCLCVCVREILLCFEKYIF